MSHYWLACTISEGLFPNERAVLTYTVDGGTSTFYVDQYFIKDPTREGNNSVRVRGYQAKPGIYHVILPGEPFETSRNIVVKSDQIEEPAV